MTKLALVAAATTACAANTTNLERKVDDLAAQLAQTQREVGELRRRVDTPPPAPPPVPDTAQLEHKLDELQRKLDAIKVMPPPPPRPGRVEPDRSKVYAVAIDGYPADGKPDAKVTMVIAHDYADPYSERVRATLDDLRKKYGADLRIVYRNFVVHPRVATAAALASCAAAKQGKFAAFEDVVWEKGYKARQFDKDVDTDQGPQKCWNLAEGCAFVVAFAQEAHLAIDRFRADMKACEASVTADQKELQTLGIGATPSFFINGRYMSGAMPIDQFTPLIDEELAKADERIRTGTPKGRYYRTWVLAKGLTKVEP
jgi:protein-disulfide isomerase